MKKQIIATILATFLLCSAKAQEFKLTKTTGKLNINLSGATIEGYNGSEIIFSSLEKSSEVDERAKGLRSISGSGFEDNTGIGISVIDKGSTVEVNQVSKKNTGQIKIMVPKGLIISFTHDKVMNQSKVKFKNIENEIEVSVQYNEIDLDNITGPMTIKTVYGSVDANLGTNIKGPISIVSVYGHVDVALPVNSKVNINMNTSWGELFAAGDFKIDMEKSGEYVKYNNDQVKGKINGGGAELSLKSSYGKVYLRKK
jgi:hypothetical protein